MISFDEIKKNFPAVVNVEKNSRDMIKEALQYKALNIIFSSEFANTLVFIGGTNLRIFHDIQRFSEDIDFDVLPGKEYTIEKHERLLNLIKTELSKEGYELKYNSSVTKENVITGKLSFPGLQYKLKTSSNPNDVVHIKVEAQPHGFDYKPEKKIINKYGAFGNVNIMPVDLIFATKLFTAIQRKKGRDFYDIVELSSFAKANGKYVKFRANKKGYKYTEPNDIKRLIQENIKDINWKEKINEVSLFLFNKADVKKVEMFPQWLDQMDFSKIINSETQGHTVSKVKKNDNQILM